MARPKKPLHIIIDGDPLVYRAGFAVEQTTYQYVSEDGPLTFPDRASLDKYAEKEKIVLDNYNVSVLRTVEPVENALQALRTQVRSIISSAYSKYKPGFYSTHIYISKGENFRHKIATVAGYKANRDKLHKPAHYKQLRNALRYDNAIEVVGREADDECSIRAHQFRADGERYVIATIDKDLDQIPGEHYNYMAHKFYRVTAEQANRWFWVQVLAGDTVDNVPGCWRVGLRKAQKFVDDRAIIGFTDEEMWADILKEFESSKARPGCKYKERDAAEVALEMARLVKLQTYPGQLWNPPGEGDGYIEESTSE